MATDNAANRTKADEDKRLDKELEETFPASDTPSVLRKPESKDNGLDAARIDRRPPVTKPDDGKARQDTRGKTRN